MHLFTYGCLMIPEAMERITGRCFRHEEAVLRGYVRLRVKHRMDAALIRFPDTHTEGRVYFDVDAEALGRIDRFEGALYRRTSVNIETSAGEWVEAETYVFRLPERKRLTASAWDPDDFRSRHLERFLHQHPPCPGDHAAGSPPPGQ